MKKIIPTYGKVVLSRDECIRVGKYVIGYWEKDNVGGSMHYRPSVYEGSVIYGAKLNNGDYVKGWTMAELRERIVEAGKDGIETEEE